MTTSTISARLSLSSATILSELSKKYNTPKSRILENALISYAENEIRANIRSSYAMIGKDTEMLDLANIPSPEFLKSY